MASDNMNDLMQAFSGGGGRGGGAGRVRGSAKLHLEEPSASLAAFSFPHPPPQKPLSSLPQDWALRSTRLMAWVREWGGVVDGVEMAPQGAWLGVRATQTLAVGHVAVAIPPSLQMRRQVALKDPTFGIAGMLLQAQLQRGKGVVYDLLREWDALFPGVFVLTSYLFREAFCLPTPTSSFFHPYLSTLPPHILLPATMDANSLLVLRAGGFVTDMVDQQLRHRDAWRSFCSQGLPRLSLTLQPPPPSSTSSTSSPPPPSPPLFFGNFSDATRLAHCDWVFAVVTQRAVGPMWSQRSQVPPSWLQDASFAPDEIALVPVIDSIPRRADGQPLAAAQGHVFSKRRKGAVGVGGKEGGKRGGGEERRDGDGSDGDGEGGGDGDGSGSDGEERNGDVERNKDNHDTTNDPPNPNPPPSSNDAKTSSFKGTVSLGEEEGVEDGEVEDGEVEDGEVGELAPTYTWEYTGRGVWEEEEEWRGRRRGEGRGGDEEGDDEDEDEEDDQNDDSDGDDVFRVGRWLSVVRNGSPACLSTLAVIWGWLDAGSGAGDCLDIQVRLPVPAVSGEALVSLDTAASRALLLEVWESGVAGEVSLESLLNASRVDEEGTLQDLSSTVRLRNAVPIPQEALDTLRLRHLRPDEVHLAQRVLQHHLPASACAEARMVHSLVVGARRVRASILDVLHQATSLGAIPKDPRHFTPGLTLALHAHASTLRAALWLERYAHFLWTTVAFGPATPFPPKIVLQSQPKSSKKYPQTQIALLDICEPPEPEPRS